MEEITKLPQRSEVAKENTWATEDMYVSDEAWEAELKTVAADKDALAAFAGKLGESGETLCAYLTLMEKVDEKLSPLYATKYDYWYVPAFYVNERKIHEGVPTMEAVENALKTALAED